MTNGTKLFEDFIGKVAITAQKMQQGGGTGWYYAMLEAAEARQRLESHLASEIRRDSRGRFMNPKKGDSDG